MQKVVRMLCVRACAVVRAGGAAPLCALCAASVMCAVFMLCDVVVDAGFMWGVVPVDAAG